MTANAAPGLVMLLASEWSRYHRPALVRALAASGDGPVLVIDNPVCLTTARWHRPERWARWRSTATPAARLRRLGDDLWLLDTAVLLHDRLASHLPGLRQINRRLLARQLCAALAHLGLAGPWVSWFQFPTQQHYPGLLGEALSVYECFDEHADLPGLSAPARQRLVGLERRLMARCGLVLTTSLPLYEARRAQHGNVVLSYNAADPAQFAPVAADSLAGVDRRRHGPPTLGYLGTLHEHTDLALLADLAERRPDWPLLLIGPLQPGADPVALARLRAAANVELYGWVEADALASLLCRIDVGLIPYRSGARFNRHVNPNKLHEYTAMGKPVVASAGLDLSSHPVGPVVADGVDGFIAAIADQHAGNSRRRVTERLALAERHSWQARALAIRQHIARSLPAGATASAGRRP